MALGGLPIAVVLVENNASWFYWGWWLFGCFIWTHLAYYLSTRSGNPYKTEKYNLTFDSFIAGTWVSLTYFNLLPAAILVIITMADKISTGIRNLWLYSIPVIILGALIGAVITGFAFQPQSSVAVVVASIPIMTIHTLLVSFGSHRLIRKVRNQNRLLTTLSQNDTLTSLFNRRHWQQEAELLISQCEGSDKVVSLMIVDIDHFKQINDKYGHSIGDEVIQYLANILTISTPNDALIGRLGGDEFAIVVQKKLSDAKIIANEIVNAVNNHQHSDMRIGFTLSVGVAELDKVNCTFRAWFDAADKALYQAKKLGRNQVALFSS